MSRPIAVFGLPENKFVKQVLSLRQKLLAEGKIEETEILTLPHLTILINSSLDDLVSDNFLIQKVTPLVSVLKEFSLTITGFEKLDNSIIAKFDTGFTRKLVYQMTTVLPGFRSITTDYIKILRRVVPEHLDQTLETVKETIGTQVLIDRIAIAGGSLRQEDIIWTGQLYAILK